MKTIWQTWELAFPDGDLLSEHNLQLTTKMAENWHYRVYDRQLKKAKSIRKLMREEVDYVTWDDLQTLYKWENYVAAT